MVEFVEMPPFARHWQAFLTPDELRALQTALLSQPELGEVMQDCGGLRKLRWAEKKRGKGKRGGCRIIYLLHPEAQRIDLVTIYDKNEADDVTAEQRKVLRGWAEAAKREVKRTRATRRSSKQ